MASTQCWRSEATSANPRFTPWPASGWIRWAASLKPLTQQQIETVVKVRQSALRLCSVTCNDVTKLVKICIRRIGILTFKICRMRMQMDGFILLVGTQCTGFGQLNHCNNMLFPKVNKNSVHISTTHLWAKMMLHIQ